MTQRTDWLSVVTLAVATLVIARELSMSAFALPLIAERFDVASDFTAGVLLFYLIPLAGLSIPAGKWADRADLRLAFADRSSAFVLQACLLLCRPPQAGKSRLVDTRREVERGWQVVGEQLPHKGRADLGMAVRRFVDELSPARTEKEWIRDGIRQ